MNGNDIVTIPEIELTAFERFWSRGFIGEYLSTHTFPTLLPIILLMTLGFLLAAVAAYVLGSLNVGIILSTRVYKQDIRELGSKNAGATNMARVFGGKAGLFTILGEFLKTFLCVMIGRILFGTMGAYVSGLFAVLGQIFPLFYKFRGGKGVAATAAVMLFTNPVVFLVEFLVFVIIAGGTKFISLASIAAAFLYPVFLNSLSGPGYHNLIAIVIACLVFFRHKENMKRLWNKEERKFDFGAVFKSKKRKLREEEAARAAAEAEAAEIEARNAADKNGASDE